MSAIVSDIRFALRTFGRYPGFAAVAIATLALGIGANTAIFSVVRGVLLASLPYRDVARLVRIGHATAESNRPGSSFSPQDFDDLRDSGAGLSAAAAYSFVPGLTGLNLVGVGEPRRLQASFVSSGFFEVLGASAAKGRALLASENVPGRDNVVVVSDRIWKEILAASPDAVGKKLDLDGQPFTVVGVMPSAFQFPDAAVDVWVPLSLMGENEVPHQRGIRWLSVVARLDSRTSVAGAKAKLDSLFRQLEAKYSDSNRGFGRALVVPLEKALLGEVRTPLLILLGAVSLVLLIACANVANLLLARATARRREIAVRLAIGASPGRIVRQLLAESVLLALAGGALGLLAAEWGVQSLVVLTAGRIPRADQIRPDAAVAAFSFGLSVTTGILFGLFPAWRAARPDVAAELESQGRGGTGRSAGPRKALVVAETVLAVVLLSCAGLLVKSLWRLMHVATGARPEGVLALSIDIPEWKYPTDAKTNLYRAQILARLRALPGVVAVGASKTMPFSDGGERYGFTIERRQGTSEIIRPPAGALIVTPGYFEALGIPILRGRDFADRDLETMTRVVIVNSSLAHQLWPTDDAVGKRVRFGPRVAEMEIIGVAADVRHQGLREPPAAAIYVPISIFQRPSLTIFVRARTDPRTLIPAVRAVIRRIDPDQPISEIETLTQAISEEASRPRFYALMLALFAALALTLAGSGLYAILSYGIAQRRREIGVRMALGAEARDVLRLVLADGLGSAALGTAVGLVLAAAASRLLASLLYEVHPLDLEVFAAVPLFLLLVAAAAALHPAWTASRTDPMKALRSE